MKKKNRQDKILSILRAMQKEVQVEELAKMLDVSTLTIRRDLKDLGDSGVIIRTPGGGMLAERVALVKEYREYHKRVAINFDLKQKIGEEAASLVKPGETILINDGTTTFHMITKLGGVENLTIYTNSLVMANELNHYSNISVNILGGEVNKERYSVSGPITELVLENMFFDKIFLGVHSIDEMGRCFVKRSATARFSQIVLKSGTEKIMLADHTKVKKESGFAYGNLSEFDHWITTAGVNIGMLEKFRQMTRVTVVK